MLQGHNYIGTWCGRTNKQIEVLI